VAFKRVILFGSITLNSGERELPWGPGWVGSDVRWSCLSDSHSEKYRARRSLHPVGGADGGRAKSIELFCMSLVTSFNRHVFLAPRNDN
jgi:hypothetical protein